MRQAAPKLLTALPRARLSVERPAQQELIFHIKSRSRFCSNEVQYPVFALKEVKRETTFVRAAKAFLNL